MCVLTFLPTINSGYILTNNRDEALARPKAIPPKKYNINGKQIYFPKDAQAGGTWIATSDDLTVCLLNGASENHIHNPPYRQSRGQLILDFSSLIPLIILLKITLLRILRILLW